jgi:hypothetical protein
VELSKIAFLKKLKKLYGYEIAQIGPNKMLEENDLLRTLAVRHLHGQVIEVLNQFISEYPDTQEESEAVIFMTISQVMGDTITRYQGLTNASENDLVERMFEIFSILKDKK